MRFGLLAGTQRFVIAVEGAGRTAKDTCNLRSVQSLHEMQTLLTRVRGMLAGTVNGHPLMIVPEGMLQRSKLFFQDVRRCAHGMETEDLHLDRFLGNLNSRRETRGTVCRLFDCQPSRSADGRILRWRRTCRRTHEDGLVSIWGQTTSIRIVWSMTAHMNFCGKSFSA